MVDRPVDFPYEGLLRKPVRADAGAIYRLKRMTIGKQNLRFTVFRSPLSVSYLEELIVEERKSSEHRMMVLEYEGQLAGYYMAGASEGTWFLNYIGVSPTCTGRGFGNLLLVHFEQIGVRLGFDRFALDVFDNNPGARDWYLRHHYQPEGARYFEVVMLPELMTLHHSASGIESLGIKSDEWSAALAEERRRGFSNIEARCQGARIRVGLIGGTALRIMAVDGMELEQAAGVLAVHFGKQRKELLLTGMDRPSSLSVVTRETALRMTRSVVPAPGLRESHE